MASDTFLLAVVGSGYDVRLRPSANVDAGEQPAMVTVEAPDVVAGEGLRALPGESRRLRRYGPVALLLVAVGVWLTAIALMRGEIAGQFGLLAAQGGVLLLASVVAGIVAFVWALAINGTLYAVLAIVAVVVFERVTATVLTDLPIYVWTYKHIGIVNYMIEGHSSPHIQIYGDWPSFFAGMAWFSTISGLDPLTVAHWFAPFSAALSALLVGVLAVSAGFSTRVGLVAAMLAVVLNWTGQDYYSPQATGLIFALSILTLLLHSKKAPLAGFLSVPLFAVLVATHQLTPFWLFLVVVGLAVFKQIRPRWLLPVVFGAILAVYVIPRLNRAARFDFFSGFNPLKNSAVIAEGPGSDGRAFTILLERGLFVALWASAVICFVIVWRRRGAPWALGIIAFSSVLILAGQDYGGEAIIRVYLYSIAGSAILIAIILARLCDLERPWRKGVGCLVATVFIAGAGVVGLQGYYGGWSYVTVSRSQLEHSRQLLAASEGRLVIGTIAQSVGWPEGSTAASVRTRLQDPAYDAVFDDLRPSLLHKDFATREDVERIQNALPKNGRARTLYVVLPRQLHAYGEYLGWFPPTFVPSLIEILSATPKWTKVIDDEDTVVFAYSPKRR
jgi:hypothetical protein